jgi:general secretion pathway protein K
MALRRDHGFAMVVAVAALGAFAFIAFEVLAADRGVIAGVSARVEQARLAAAADAGMMMAIHGIAQEDASQRWAINGHSREITFRGVDLLITVEDERGKAPLDGLNPAQSRALFEGAGASDDRLDALVDELRDFQSADDDQTGATNPTEAQGLAAAPLRHGGFRTVGDLMVLKDMDANLYARIAPAVTVFFEESGPFERANASPLAAATMRATENDSPDEEQMAQSVDDEHPTESIEDENMIGRSLTVNVVARGPGGVQTHRMAIVELTGSGDAVSPGGQPPSPGGKVSLPYWIRYVE